MLKRDSFVVKVAYHGIWIPRQVSLCKLFWQFVGNLIMISLDKVFRFSLFALSAIAAFFIAGYRWGWIPDKSGGKQPRLREIGFWPKVFGKRLWPVYLWGPVAVFLVVPWDNLVQSAISHSAWIIQIVSTMLFVRFGMWLYNKYVNRTRNPNKIGTWGFIRQYVKAKKKRLCPMVEIEPLHGGLIEGE